MNCPNCNSSDLRVLATNSTPDNHVLRNRKCHECKLKIFTLEVCVEPEHVHWVSRKAGNPGSKLKLVTNLSNVYDDLLFNEISTNATNQ
ncbi:MAG: hypothetical protein EBS18_04230 [Actinobacteria bacterium]|nr:hypothetical protein [Actinomycetota bacterium]